MFQAGQVLNGRYKLQKPLGQGSQAHVWVAEHLALGSQVAVKLIEPELAKQQDARDRFAVEAAAAAKLRSAHVVQILDHGIDGEQPYIVMELLEGEDLFDRLARRVQLSLGETSRIVTQVCRALMRAHAEGVIHRDMKPENVFLVRNDDDDEIAKVLDFGVAKVATPQKAAMARTGVGTLIGTPHYMSPEQVKGLSEIDYRSDLWSVGIITYQCLTGRLPFDSEGVGDLLIRITMNEPLAPSKINPSLPAELDAWFAKACHKDATARFQTARELADALARIARASEAPTSPSPVSQSGRVLVSLTESNDLDWGSLAGLPIPTPGAPAVSPGPSSTKLQVEGTAEPGSNPFLPGLPVARRSPVPATPYGPPSERAVPSVPAASAPTPPPRPAPPSDFLAPPSALNAPAFSPPASRVTVDLDAFDGELGRKRRAAWVVGGLVLVAAIAVTAGVLGSRGGLSSLLGESDAPTPSAPAATVSASSPSLPTPEANASASAAPSSSAAAPSIVFDPSQTKKGPVVGGPNGAPRPGGTLGGPLPGGPLPGGSLPGGSLPGGAAPVRTGPPKPQGGSVQPSGNGEVIIVVPDPPAE